VIPKNLSGNGALVLLLSLFFMSIYLFVRFKRTGKRNEIFLASKFGIFYNTVTHDFSLRGDKDYVKEAFNRSLSKLGVDTIDLYYLQR
jgi:aryl-alcohol dehydrogenase-like predicted oxidoreductase